jgi:hypothetical protein
LRQLHEIGYGDLRFNPAVLIMSAAADKLFHQNQHVPIAGVQMTVRSLQQICQTCRRFNLLKKTGAAAFVQSIPAFFEGK